MKDLRPHKVMVNTLGKEELLSLPVRVSPEGEFSMVVPEYIKDNVRQLASTMFTDGSVRPSIGRGRLGEGKMQVVGARLADIERLVNGAFKAWSKPQESMELVILYNVKLSASFSKDDKGKLWPSPHFSEVVGGCKSRWEEKDLFGSLHAGQPSEGGYHIGVGARVFEKWTMRRGGVTKVRYAHPWRDDHFALDNWGQKLNGYVAMGVVEERYDLGDKDGLDPDWMKNFPTVHEIPYTEKSAKFFFDIIAGICNMANALSMYLNVPEKRLMELIAISGEGVLLLNASKAKP